MKIWIDITNSPHVNLFAGLYRELKDAHEIIITCRSLANTKGLLENKNIPFTIVGKHYGKKPLNKISGFLIRITQLFIFLKNKNVDVSISHSSFYSPAVSKILKIKCIYMNDNEHAQGNRISFLFADKIMIPEYLNIKKVKNQWASDWKIIRYPGVKEGIYLWMSKKRKSDGIGLKTSKGIQNIYIRPEPWTAQYYKGAKNFIDNLLIQLKEKYRIIILPRSVEQEHYYQGKKFDGIEVQRQSIDLHVIMADCDLFIGAGGTMTREAAVLGVPTISIYQEKLLDVDQYLIETGLMIHKGDLTPEFVIEFIKKQEKQKPNTKLLAKGKTAYELMKKSLIGQTMLRK